MVMKTQIYVVTIRTIASDLEFLMGKVVGSSRSAMLRGQRAAPGSRRDGVVFTLSTAWKKWTPSVDLHVKSHKWTQVTQSERCNPSCIPCVLLHTTFKGNEIPVALRGFNTVLRTELTYINSCPPTHTHTFIYL